MMIIKCVRMHQYEMRVQSLSKSKRSEINFAVYLELVHSDVMDPMQIKRRSGEKCAVTFIDDYFRCIFTYLIAS